MAAAGRAVQYVEAVVVRGRNLGAVLEQQLADLQVAGLGRDVQRRGAERRPLVDRDLASLDEEPGRW